MGDQARRACDGDNAADAKRRRLSLLASIVLIGTSAAVVFHYVMAYYLGRGYPYNTFLFLPSDHFNDWNNTYRYVLHFLQGRPAPFVYFPFAFLLVAGATLLPMSVGLALLVLAYVSGLVTLLWRTVLDVLPGRQLKLQYAVILVALSYPVLFTLDRGNLEMLVFLLVGGMFFFVYRRPSGWGAGLCLAAAVAMKLYPATLVVLLLAERRLKAAAVAVVGALGLTVGATGLLALLTGQSMGAVWHQAYAEKGTYQGIQVDAGAGMQHGHTLWGLLRAPSLLMHGYEQPWLHSAYLLAVAAIFALLAGHVLLRESEPWRKAALMVIAAITLPFVSADYTTPLIYFPLVMFLNSRRVSRYDLVYVALFGVLLVPVDYRYLPALGTIDASTSVIVYAAALTGLAALTIADAVRQEAAAPATRALRLRAWRSAR